MNPFKLLLLAWIEARAFGAAHARLQRLSDNELNDIGLDRTRIVGTALRVAERRSAAFETGIAGTERTRHYAALHGALG